MYVERASNADQTQSRGSSALGDGDGPALREGAEGLHARVLVGARGRGACVGLLRLGALPGGAELLAALLPHLGSLEGVVAAHDVPAANEAVHLGARVPLARVLAPRRLLLEHRLPAGRLGQQLIQQVLLLRLPLLAAVLRRVLRRKALFALGLRALRGAAEPPVVRRARHAAQLPAVVLLAERAPVPRARKLPEQRVRLLRAHLVEGEALLLLQPL
mmetsp:Transcript_15301/g.39519  ORF Transcript_15301/g.39519 Transcript_15301/m.39519 type:complete len:217 (-) Transcript_15301:364-1014(-)